MNRIRYKKSLISFIIGLFCMLTVLVCYIYADTIPEKAPGNCFDNLSFGVEEDNRIEQINCFSNNRDDIYYLFLPAYAKRENITIDYKNASEVIIKGTETNESFHIERGGVKCTLEIGQTYDISFLDSKDEVLETGKLEVLQSKNLPAMYIFTDSGSLDYLNSDKNNYETGFLSMYTADGTLEYCDELKKISGRGNDSWEADKRSYGIKLDRKTNLEKMGSAKDWVLLPNVTDVAYIRNKITYDMAADAGMYYVPESCFVDLYVNNVYHGLYQICEKVEIDRERIDIYDLEEENNKLNVDAYLNDTIAQIQDRMYKYADLARTPRDISGGYLLERDYGSKYVAEVSGFKTEILGDTYTIKSPVYASKEEVEYIKGYVDGMEAAILSPDGIDPSTGKHYTEYIDVDSYAMKYLIEEISKNNGAGATSSFYYKPLGTKLIDGPVWDYDKAYGNYSNILSTSPQGLSYITLHVMNTLFYRNLYEQQDFQDLVRKKYKDFFSDYLDYLVNEKIDSYYAWIKPSAEMDSLRWKYSENTHSPEEYEMLPDHIEYIKNFIAERKKFLDRVWIDEVPMCTITFEVDTIWGIKGKNYCLGIPKGETLKELPDFTALYIDQVNGYSGWFYKDTDIPFDESVPITEDIVIVAK